MTVKVYASHDVGAPTLRGQAGSLIALLDACLVNGYGSQTSAGWTKPYSSTTLIGAYRPPSGNRMYLQVNDTCSGAGWLYNGYDAALVRSRFVGYETMTAINTGTNQFPSPPQSPNLSGDGAIGLYLRKSVSADTYNRRWLLLATSTFMWLWIDSDSNQLPTGYTTAAISYPSGALYCFGDLIPSMTGDAYATFIMGDVGTLGYSTGAYSGSYAYTPTPFNTSCQGHFLARSYSQTGSSITAGKTLDYSKINFPTPNPIDGTISIVPVYAYEGGAPGYIRGRIPGFYQLGHAPGPYQYGDLINGTGDLAGKQFIVVPTNGSRNRLLEISDTW